MDLQQVRKEIEELSRSPVSEKMYPITSNWVPISDVMAVLNRFEKHWRNYKNPKDGSAQNLVTEILGK
jgi:hypothetical protein